MTFKITCQQCGEQFTDPNPHEDWCSGTCFKQWYIANRNPGWQPMKQPKRKKGGGLPFIFGLLEDDEDAA
jgi:hypothetical protein